MELAYVTSAHSFLRVIYPDATAVIHPQFCIAVRVRDYEQLVRRVPKEPFGAAHGRCSHRQTAGNTRGRYIASRFFRRLPPPSLGANQVDAVIIIDALFAALPLLIRVEGLPQRLAAIQGIPAVGRLARVLDAPRLILRPLPLPALPYQRRLCRPPIPPIATQYGYSATGGHRRPPAMRLSVPAAADRLPPPETAPRIPRSSVRSSRLLLLPGRLRRRLRRVIFRRQFRQGFRIGIDIAIRIKGYEYQLRQGFCAPHPPAHPRT